MNITSRAQWGARPPRSVTLVSWSERRYFVVHYSGAPATQTVRAIQDWCMNAPPHGRGFADIDYNHLVRGTTGEIYEGRGWNVVGAHATGYNTNGVGICVIGDGPISVAAKRSVRWLYEQYNARCGRTLTLRGHRDVATTGTDCPGNTIEAWVRAGLPAPDGEDDDMPTAQEIAAAVWAYQVPKGDEPGKTWEAGTVVGDTRGVAVRTWSEAHGANNGAATAVAALARFSGLDVDENAIVAGVLAGLTPERIAAAIPQSIVIDVIHALSQREITLSISDAPTPGSGPGGVSGS